MPEKYYFYKIVNKTIGQLINSGLQFVVVGVLVVILWGCNDSLRTNEVIFEEKAGVSRNLEYVKVTMGHYDEDFLFLKEKQVGSLIVGHKLNRQTSKSNSSTYIFPLSIKANEKRTFSRVDSVYESPLQKLGITGKGADIKIENKFFYC